MSQKTYRYSRKEFKKESILLAMEKENKTILIDKYITGKLEDTELWEFKANMENDAELAKEVKLRKEIYETISNSKKIELLQTLNDINSKKKRKTLKINIYSRQIQAIAASIIVLMVIGAGLLSDQLGQDLNSNIYSEYFVDEGSLITTRSDDRSDNSTVLDGIKMYDNQEYEKALSLLETNTENITARLYTGLTYMKLEMYNKAEDQFNYIINHKDNIFIDQAEWNLGLSYLANNKTDKATTIFAKIANEDSAYSKRASEIIKKLENN